MWALGMCNLNDVAAPVWFWQSCQQNAGKTIWWYNALRLNIRSNKMLTNWVARLLPTHALRIWHVSSICISIVRNHVQNFCSENCVNKTGHPSDVDHSAHKTRIKQFDRTFAEWLEQLENGNSNIPKYCAPLPAKNAIHKIIKRSNSAWSSPRTAGNWTGTNSLATPSATMNVSQRRVSFNSVMTALLQNIWYVEWTKLTKWITNKMNNLPLPMLPHNRGHRIRWSRFCQPWKWTLSLNTNKHQQPKQTRKCAHVRCCRRRINDTTILQHNKSDCRWWTPFIPINKQIVLLTYWNPSIHVPWVRALF